MDYVRSFSPSSIFALHAVQMLRCNVADWRDHSHEGYDFDGHNYDDRRGEG